MLGRRSPPACQSYGMRMLPRSPSAQQSSVQVPTLPLQPATARAGYYIIGAGVVAVLAFAACIAWQCCCAAKPRPSHALQLGYVPLLAAAAAPAVAAAAAAAPAAVAVPAVAVPAASPAASAVEDPAAIAPRYCAACGAKAAGGAFCASCGRAYAPA